MTLFPPSLSFRNLQPTPSRSRRTNTQVGPMLYERKGIPTSGAGWRLARRAQLIMAIGRCVSPSA